ncbi:MAG: hypothetical protein EOP09_13485 [Proteobacteria bacterium]|nr:MAG: hypothetical protein EOP09_13485 [Pseudomonadota bacterium]
MSSSVIQTSRRLFLHWGPGGNAQVEREYFPAHLGIDFWDRPRNSHPSAFTDGVNATQSHLEKLHAVHGPIDLIAHSFGCAIALELSFRVPTLIRSITLLSGNEDVVRGTYQLAGELVKRGLGSLDLAPTLQAAERFQSWESFQALIPALFTVPHLFSYYWAPESHQAQEKYNASVHQSSVYLTGLNGRNYFDVGAALRAR